MIPKIGKNHVTAAMVFCWSLLTSLWIPASEKDGRLDIYWVDVEGGGATLMVTPAGQSLLFDSGNPGGRDAGRIFRMATEHAGIQAIDYLITTHFHIDHFGGAAELAQLMEIRNIVDKGIPDSLVEDRSFPLRIRAYREIRAARLRIRAGENLNLLQNPDSAGITLRCIAADQVIDTFPVHESTLAGATVDSGSLMPFDPTDNARSLNFILRLGDFAFYHGGDTTWNVEGRLVTPTNPHGTVDVVQVNHHGMDSSNNPVLLRALNPTVTVMNNGHRKGCGPKTFETLSGLPSLQAMYQVRKNLREDSHINAPDQQIANLREVSDENVLKLSVAADGQTYTVDIPARSHSKTYTTRRKF